MKKNYKYLIVFFMLLVSFNACNLFFKNDKQEIIPLRYATVRSIVEAPAHVAYYNKYFQKQGLDVSMEINPDGKTSLDRLLMDSVDIASVMATPVVYRTFKRNDYCIFGVMEFSEKIHSCIARKNSGIETPLDLKGKTVGVMKGTSGEFFMNSYLILNDLLPSDINIINLNGPEMLDSIVDGNIDAMFCWEPYIILAKMKLDTGWIEFNSPKLIPSSWVFVARKNYVNENPEVIRRFLKTIVLGTEFTNNNKEEALEIHSEIANVNKSNLEDLFHKQSFKLSLKQELILDLEAQARWIIDFNYVTDTNVPEFLDIIHVDAAKEVIPHHVGFIK